MILCLKDGCTGCGRCIATCSFGALFLTTSQPGGYGKKYAGVAAGLCCGCGACIEPCPFNALRLRLDPVEQRDG